MQSLKIEGVHKSFGPVHVLKGIDIEIDPGQFLILVGPSGCGKSTLLNMIAGLEKVTSGNIFIGERDVTHLSPKDRDIAMVFQSYALYPNMSIRKNISFGLEIRKVPKAEQDATVNRVAKMLQIEHLLDRKPSQLSGGQRQRVAMGRALARDPAVFLFDEPLSNLDAKLRVEMRTEIKELHQRTGTSIVYVTHDQIEAMTLGDQIAVMKEGEIHQLGSPQEVYDNPANQFVAGFMGSPSMNFIPVKVVQGESGLGLQMEGKAGAFVLPAGPRAEALESWRDKTLTLGIRPEQITQAGGEQQPENSHNAPCKIEIIEPTGPDTLAFIKLNDTKVVCRTHPSAGARPGEVLELAFDMSNAVFFDPQTEQRVG
ncbi:MAG: sn-glycerol-3-phosphate ABC transporter ATP-binding protein UgpC [Chromatiales bacterium]|jgi:multiple sugar transport system ATP-binding protein